MAGDLKGEPMGFLQFVDETNLPPDLKIQEEEEEEIFLENKEKSDKKKIYVSCFEDLPQEIQRQVKKAEINIKDCSYGKNFEILLNVIKFVNKKHFKLNKEIISQLKKNEKQEENKSFDYSETSSHAPLSMLIKIESTLIRETHENMKKIFKNLEFSGKGGFGRVFFAQRVKDKGTVAIKKMDNTNEKEVLSNLSEIAFLSIFSHPNIVKYIASYKVKKEVWMIMEFMEGGTLSEAVKAYNFYESQIAYVAREILKGLEYLHSMNYGHRDLKSSNVMMTVQGQIKLIDFGLCTDFSNGPKQHTVGSPFWIPPEMIQNKPHNLKVDIWSFAVCILEMVLKAPPYRESKMKAMYLVGTEGLLPLVNKTKMSDNLKDFFHKCLQMEPSQRNSAKELLQHKFIQNADNQKSMESIIASIFLRKSMTKGGVI